MKTKEERNAPNEEAETVSKKLNKLTEEEMEQVTGGGWAGFDAQQNLIPPSAESFIAPKPCKEGESGWEKSTMQPVLKARGLDFNIQPATTQTTEPPVTPLPYVQLSSDWDPKQY